MEKEDVRKGPWTEQEDVQLVFYVKLFGDRRWDFVAKVSGLKRTGKSCRLRWVNYLHPDLKRGKMTPREESLVLELHAKYGNRWSKIARKLPGRTDNEIKNYWRTYTRKTARENKKTTVTSPTSSSSSSNSSSPYESNSPIEEMNERSFYDTGGKNNTLLVSATAPPQQNKTGLQVFEDSAKVYSMDEIWKDIELSEENNVDFASQAIITPSSPLWDFNPITTDSLWCVNEEEQSKMLMNPQPFNSYNPFY